MPPFSTLISGSLTIPGAGGKSVCLTHITPKTIRIKKANLRAIPTILIKAIGEKSKNLTKENFNEDMGLEYAQVVGDSGGYQIASGAWKWDDKKKDELRKKVFTWLEHNSDIGMNLDLPPMLKLDGKFNYCLEESYENFKYFNEHQTGKTRFLNILQGMTEEQYKIWYKKMKDFGSLLQVDS